jgi:CRISPR-associated exonuclease Cas4
VAAPPVHLVGSDLPVVSAADLEKFGYCPLSWWRSMEAQSAPAPPPMPADSTKQLAAGQAAHELAGESLKEIRTGEQVVAESEAYIWVFAGVAVGLAFVGFAVTAVGLQVWPEPLIPLVISLVWLLTAVLLFRLGLKYYERVREQRAAMAAAEGAVVYVGEGKTVDEDPALFSHRLGLVGAPDSVVEREGLFIPVELKTGRVPKGPFFSHVLQVIAYCALVEEKYGKAPPFGIVKYGPAAEFEVEYGERQKKLLEDMLGEMRRAFVTKDVHRNHDRPGKCASCSRREGCPERLDRTGA